VPVSGQRRGNVAAERHSRSEPNRQMNWCGSLSALSASEREGLNLGHKRGSHTPSSRARSTMPSGVYPAISVATGSHPSMGSPPVTKAISFPWRLRAPDPKRTARIAASLCEGALVPSRRAVHVARGSPCGFREETACSTMTAQHGDAAQPVERGLAPKPPSRLRRTHATRLPRTTPTHAPPGHGTAVSKRWSCPLSGPGLGLAANLSGGEPGFEAPRRRRQVATDPAVQSCDLVSQSEDLISSPALDRALVPAKTGPIDGRSALLTGHESRPEHHPPPRFYRNPPI